MHVHSARHMIVLLCKVMTHDAIIPRMTNQVLPRQNYTVHVILVGVKLPKKLHQKNIPHNRFGECNKSAILQCTLSTGYNAATCVHINT